MGRVGIAGLLAGSAAVAAALALPPYDQYICGELGVLMLVISAVNLIFGVAGVFSIASPAFIGIGGTALGYFASNGYPLWAGFAVAIVAGGIGGWLVAGIAARVQDIYLAIVTVAIIDAFSSILDVGGTFTGGGYGFVMPPLNIPVLSTLSSDGVALLALFFGVGAIPLFWGVFHSRPGRAWTAIRDHPAAAELYGIGVPMWRGRALAWGGCVLASAGGLQAMLLGVVSPTQFSASAAVDQLSVAVVGGLGLTPFGAVVGPILLVGVPRFLSSLGQYLGVFYGGLMLCVLVLAPRGLSRLLAVGVRRLPGSSSISNYLPRWRPW